MMREVGVVDAAAAPASSPCGYRPPSYQWFASCQFEHKYRVASCQLDPQSRAANCQDGGSTWLVTCIPPDNRGVSCCGEKHSKPWRNGSASRRPKPFLSQVLVRSERPYGKDFDFVVSGSLLGVELKDIRSMPVGYLSEVEMFPLDFEEFCWAQGVADAVIAEARAAFERIRSVDEFVHARLLQTLHVYLVVGGDAGRSSDICGKQRPQARSAHTERHHQSLSSRHQQIRWEPGVRRATRVRPRACGTQHPEQALHRVPHRGVYAERES